VALLCGLADPARPHLRPGGRPGRALEAARRWADGDPAVREADLREAASGELPYPAGDAGICADAAAAAPARLALAAGPGVLCGMARLVAENAASACALAAGAESDAGLRGRVLARMAGVVRGLFPDAEATLAGKAAETGRSL
jgi:hypothetical protein